MLFRKRGRSVLPQSSELLFAFERSLKDKSILFEPCSLLHRTKTQPSPWRAYPSPHTVQKLPLDFNHQLLRSRIFPKNPESAKFSHQIKHSEMMEQPFSCGRKPDTGQFLSLFTHPRPTAAISNTCLLFSAMHTMSLPPEGPLYTLLSCLLAPALLYKVIEITLKCLQILQGSCLKHHSVFLKIFMLLRKKK